MSNPKYTEEQRSEFKHRLLAIENLLPATYGPSVSKKLRISKDIVRNVRQGKTINFKVLAALEALCETQTQEVSK